MWVNTVYANIRLMVSLLHNYQISIYHLFNQNEINNGHNHLVNYLQFLNNINVYFITFLNNYENNYQKTVI